LLRLASTGNKAAKRPGKTTGKPTSKTTGKPTGKPIGKPSGKPTGKPTDKPAAKPTGTSAANAPRAATKNPTRHGKLASRQIAYDILVAIEDGAQLDKALAANQDLPQLDERDRKFVRLLVSTSLRHRGQLEKVMAPMISRRPFGAQAHANLVLLLGAVQLLILKTSPHAAVDNTVELMRATGFERLCGLANAVMRRLTREGDARWQTTSHLDNLPDWLRQSWLH
jgi:16S rRNA (cytosine967-C5)-methyltransferase